MYFHIKKIKLFILFNIIVILLSSCAFENKNDNNKKIASYHLRIGVAHLSQGNYPLALKELLKAENIDPNNPIIQNNLGLAYFVREKYQKAILHFKKALDLNKTYSDARNNLGLAYIEVKKYKEAIKQINLVIQDLTYPQPEKAYLNLGIAYFKQKQFNLANNYLLEALKINKRYCLAQLYYGKTLYNLNKFSQSATTLDKAINICQKQKIQVCEPHYYSALSYYKMNQKNFAIDRLETIINNFPSCSFYKKAKNLLNIINL